MSAFAIFLDILMKTMFTLSFVGNFNYTHPYVVKSINIKNPKIASIITSSTVSFVAIIATIYKLDNPPIVYLCQFFIFYYILTFLNITILLKLNLAFSNLIP